MMRGKCDGWRGGWCEGEVCGGCGGVREGIVVLVVEKDFKMAYHFPPQACYPHSGSKV